MKQLLATAQPRRPDRQADFRVWFDEGKSGFVWYYMHHDGLEVPDSFEIMDFSGGLYAVAGGKDEEGNENVVVQLCGLLRTMSILSSAPPVHSWAM